jgi:allantoinase
MPFDATGPFNSVERLKRKREMVESQAHVDVALLATLAPGGGWKDAEALRHAGVCGFKVSLFDTDPVRFPRISDPELLDVMRVVADTHATLAIHAENNEVVKALIAYEESADSGDPRAHLRSRPPISERLGVVVALEIARELGTRLHLCHLSHPRAVDLVSWYVNDGADATVETCPHYLTFTGEDMLEQRGRLKINPPLRSCEDRDGMWASLIAGDVHVVASDHAPWPTSYKDHANIFANHSGVPGVETIVPVVLSAALGRGQACLDAAIDAMTTTPAKRFGLASRKGELAPGADADIVVFDPSASNVVDEARMHSNAGWSPYHGMSLKGRVSMTFSRGRLVWDGTTVVAKPGSGEAIHPDE